MMQKFVHLVAVAAVGALLLTNPAFASTGNEEPAAAIQFDFWGFSIAEPAEIGDLLELVGVLNPSTTDVPLDLDFEKNEYTVHIHDLKLVHVNISGPFTEMYFDSGVAEIYEDASRNAPFEYNTDPSAVPAMDPRDVPSTFMDGELLVRMAYRDYISIWFAPSGLGSIAYANTELRVTGGYAYAELLQNFLIIGWHMGGGYTNDPGAQIPAGYGMRYDTLFRWESPLPVEQTTWGGIKAAFK